MESVAFSCLFAGDRGFDLPGHELRVSQHCMCFGALGRQPARRRQLRQRLFHVPEIDLDSSESEVGIEEGRI